MKKLVFTAFAVGLGLTANVMAQVPSYVPSNGLVGWWPFNGNANDESGNGNNGTVNGATLTTDRFGNIGKAYSFDGVNDWIEVLNSPSLQNVNSMSISGWLNVNQWFQSNGNGWCPILSKSSTAQPGIYAFGIGSDRFYNNLFTKQFESTNNFSNSLNTWIYCVVVNNGSSAKFYLNGILHQTVNNFQTLSNFSSSANLFFGKDNPGILEYTNGKIDDIGIWNRALSDQEISDLYNANICYEYVTVTDTLVINTGITGYNPIMYLNTLKIWPNPSNDHITIDAGNLATMNGYSIKIEDAQGQQVFQNAVNQQQFYVDITTWGGNGLYFVRIIDPQGNTVDIKKIVLQ
jgi:hypothetical protein